MHDRKEKVGAFVQWFIMHTLYWVMVGVMLF